MSKWANIEAIKESFTRGVKKVKKSQTKERSWDLLSSQEWIQKRK